MAPFGKKKKKDKAAPVGAAPGASAAHDDPFGSGAATEGPSAKKEKVKTPKPPQPQARADVYTVLLGLAVLALVIASVFLYINYQAYGPNPLSGFPRG